MYLADVTDCGLKPRFLGEKLANGMVMAAPLGPGVDRIIVCEHGTPAADRAEETTFAEVADAWQRITGESIHHGGPTGSARSPTPPGRPPSTGAAGCCSPATPRTSTCPPAGRA